MNADDVKRLQAAELHETVGHETAKIEEAKHLNDYDLAIGSFCLHMAYYGDVDDGPDWHVYLNKRYRLNRDNTYWYHRELEERDIRTVSDIDALATLLQRARDIMSQEG